MLKDEVIISTSELNLVKKELQIEVDMLDSLRRKNKKTFLQKKNEKEINVKVYKEIGEIKKIDRNVVEKLINKMIVNKEGGS